MRARKPAPGTPVRPTLYSVLRRIHLGVALIAVFTAGVSLTALGMTALRVYADHNVRLVARSIAYTLEAPVVFHDQAATGETLAVIAASEDIARATVYDRDNRVLAEWRRPGQPQLTGLPHALGEWLSMGAVDQPILHQAQQVGVLRVSGDPRNLLHFLLQGALGLLGCLLLTAVGAHYLASRLLVQIVEPLRNLMRVAHAVRSERDFAQRTPPASIEELNALSEDFNGLLDELQTWQNQLQHENRSLAHRANHDALTGLLNRAAFVEALERAVRHAAANDEYAAVLYLDSDDFKRINDHHGHAAGDAVLVAVAQRIRASLRAGDTVARIGGDEFAVLAAALRAPRDAIHIAEHILQAMAAPIALPDGSTVRASLSIGLAVFPVHAQGSQALLHAADAAMYGAKRRSGGIWQSAEPRLDVTL
ncbi:diguanylate cyclase domain-containing protein [Cupriavidus sp. DF5525]|uniref:diguanylate cyclase domain-containing protein n=1 Tax=Cupriavidus sp. DF5525 TaxID=3160989 RepID=UPI0003B0BEAD|nr:DeoR family transcriptional regulator [Ralstonia pickettii DTP0602]